jgi:putative resolvase
VSSPGQKDDLAAQVTAMEQFCLARGLSVDEWVTEIGGGMDLTRRTFVAVMDAIERGEIATLVIAHQDRLARFGFDYLQHVATKNDCNLIVANQQSLSPDQELVHDLLAVVHTFSGRLPGLRRYDKTLKDEFGDGAR